MTILQLIIVPNGAATVPAYGYRNNNGRIPIPVFGVCSIKVINIQYHDTGGAGTSTVVQIRSDVLNAPRSPCPFLTFVDKASSAVNFENGLKEYSYERVVVNGGLTINILNAVTGAEPANFQFCVITLQIEENIN
jgi:hypothetical protein